jgi:hypothetical protein
MAFFQTKNPNLGKFWRYVQWKILVKFIAIWSFYGHLVYFVAFGYILWLFGIFFPRFGKLHQEKSGNPARQWHVSQTTIYRGGLSKPDGSRQGLLAGLCKASPDNKSDQGSML